MCVARTGARRRKQAKSNNAHLSGMGVTRYSKPDAQKSARRMAQRIATEQRIKQKAKKH